MYNKNFSATYYLKSTYSPTNDRFDLSESEDELRMSSGSFEVRKTLDDVDFHFAANGSLVLDDYPQGDELVWKKSKVRSGMIERAVPEGRCAICNEDFEPSTETIVTDCKHKFCRTCMADFLRSNTADVNNLEHPLSYLETDGDGKVHLRVETQYGVVCPHPTCDALIDEQSFERLADHKTWKTFDNYTKMMSEALRKAISERMQKQQLANQRERDAADRAERDRIRMMPPPAHAPAHDPMPLLTTRLPNEQIAHLSRSIRQLKQLYASHVKSLAKANQEPQDLPTTDAASDTDSLDAIAAQSLPAVLASASAAHVESLTPEVLQETIKRCLQKQEEEAKSIARLQCSESAPLVVAIPLEEPHFESTTLEFRNPLHLQLVVALPSLYPEVAAASVSVRTLSPACPISVADRLRLERHLNNIAKKRVGQAALALLTADAERFLCVDSAVVTAAIMDDKERSASAATAPFESEFLKNLEMWDFGSDYEVLDINDILVQKEKLTREAVAAIVRALSTHNKTPLPEESYLAASLRDSGLTIAAVCILLSRFSWNPTLLSTAFSEALTSGSLTAFLNKHGIVLLQSDDKDAKASTTTSKTDVIECPVCLNDSPAYDFFGLACGHTLCRECYVDYVKEELSSGKTTLACPSPNCKFIIDQVSLAGLLAPNRWNQYLNVTVSQYVQGNPALSWCPSKKSCEHVIQVTSSSSSEVPTHAKKDPLVIQCKCQFTYCLDCKRIGGHFPATCAECDAWEKEHPEDIRDHDYDNALSVDFIRTHSKPCPECKMPISKNGGCNHMMCRYCPHEFCWVCFGDWNSRHYACSENGMNADEDRWTDISQVKTHASFGSFYARIGLLNYPYVGDLKTRLIAAIFRQANAERKGKGNNADPEKRYLTMEDVPLFVEALELLHFNHFFLRNTCRASYILAKSGVTSATHNGVLLALVNRAMQDVRFMLLAFESENLKALNVYHVRAGTAALKATFQAIVKQLREYRALQPS